MRAAPGRLGAVAVGLLLALGGCAGTPAATDPADDDALTGTVTVFAAASLTESFEALATEFEAEHTGVDVVFGFAGSSSLATQIVEGAPADVFAAASPATMATVTDAGLAADEPVVFVRNRLTIAVPAGNPGNVTGLADFADPDLTIALCEPQVPCGAAAERVFAAAGITPAPDTLEQDVKATLRKVALDEVDAALVYRTDVLAEADAVESIAFPEADDAVNDYPIVVLADAPNPAAARAFTAFVLGEAGQRVLGDAGFDLP